MLTNDELNAMFATLLRESGPRSVRAQACARPVVERAARYSVLLYLAAAGVGTLGVVDDDVVALSNLQRQVIHSTADLGQKKVDSAALAIGKLNPNVVVEAHAERLTRDNALDLIARYEFVADGSDNFTTRYLVSDACYFGTKPLSTAAVGTFDGTLTTIRAHSVRRTAG